MAQILRHITRKRPLDNPPTNQSDQEAGDEGKPERCLTTFDLVSLGVGSCSGSGMYITTGIIASKMAGPGAIISMVLAGLVSVLTALHYAELAGLCPYKSGSAYVYAYVAVGELSAFLIGWGLIVEYMIGTAAGAVALSETIDSVTDGAVSNFFNEGFDHIGFPHIDVVAAVVCVSLTLLLASGVHMSAVVNNALNILNFVVWLVFVCATYYFGKIDTWSGNGGFLPYGYAGVMSAIPTAYFAYVGFDGLATTGAECKDPVKSIPISIVLSVIINIVMFTTVVAGLTVDVPYSSLPANTAVLDVFVLIGYPALKYVMAVGAVASLLAAAFGSLFPLPRMLQAMADDGLIFRYFAHICPKRHTAVRATFISGIAATVLAAFIELAQLIELVLIGTLTGYIIVTFVTLVVRLRGVNQLTTLANGSGSSDQHNTIGYTSGMKRKSSDTNLGSKLAPNGSAGAPSTQGPHSEPKALPVSGDDGLMNTGYQANSGEHYPRKSSFTSVPNHNEDYKGNINRDGMNEESHMFKTEKSRLIDSSSPGSGMQNIISRARMLVVSVKDLPSYMEQNVMAFLFCLYGGLFVVCAMLANLYDHIKSKNIAVTVVLCIVVITMTTMSVMLMLLPQDKRSTEGYRAPLVPLITVIAAAINIFLMTSLSYITWLSFLVWLVLGASIYVFYGITHSTLNRSDRLLKDDVEVKVALDMVQKEQSRRGREKAPLLY